MIKKQKISYITFIIIGSLFISGISFAQEGNTSLNNDQIKKDLYEKNNLELQKERNNIENLKREKIDSLNFIKTEGKKDIKDTRVNFKAEVGDLQKEFKNINIDTREINKDILEKYKQIAKAQIENGEKTKDVMIKLHEEMKSQREKAGLEIQLAREDFKNNIIEKRDNLKDIFDKKREELLLATQIKRDTFDQEIKTKKEEPKESIQIKRDKLKKDLEKIKDEKKKNKVEEISNRLSHLNTKAVDRLNNNINKIESTLLSIESRVDKLAINNIDVSSIRSSILDTEKLIFVARNTVALQASKVYIVNITDESKLKIDINSSYQNLKADIKLTNETVKTTHQSLVNITKMLSTIPKVDEFTIENNLNINNN